MKRSARRREDVPESASASEVFLPNRADSLAVPNRRATGNTKCRRREAASVGAVSLGCHSAEELNRKALYCLSPEMGTIALRGVEYAEDVNFSCDASAAQQSV